MKVLLGIRSTSQLAGSSMVIANGLHNNPITKIIEQNYQLLPT